MNGSRDVSDFPFATGLAGERVAPRPTFWRADLILMAAAVFLSPMNYLRASFVYVTLSDLVVILALVVMIAQGRVPLMPFGRASVAWYCSVFLLAFGLMANLAVALNAVGLLVDWRDEAERALRTLARTDSLTGLLNRRALHDEAAALIAQARRHGDPLSLLVIDIDHFKAINDSRGHATGDRALCLLAATLQAALRRGDLAGRWGGEEFCVLLARTAPADAAAFDARLRTTLADRARAELGFDLGFSTGLAALQAADADLQPLVQRADAALYAAKAAGRGQLATAPG